MKIEPPYGAIATYLRRGQVIPFLGAGVNLGIGEPSKVSLDNERPNFPPSSAKLSHSLISRSGFPSKAKHDIDDLAKVASYFEETVGRPDLREHLREMFDHSFDVGDIHKYLAEVPANLLIVTTNYDDLTEQAFNIQRRPYDLVVHSTDRKDVEASVLWWKHGTQVPVPVHPTNLYIDLKKTSVIYKMHGTVDRTTRQWDSFVITEDDYVDFLSRMAFDAAVPSIFMEQFCKNHFLFLGYGLRDWNLRVVLKKLKDKLPTKRSADAGRPTIERDSSANPSEEVGNRTSWAIQYKPSLLEKELWNARNVKIYDVEINEFVKRLRGVLK